MRWRVGAGVGRESESARALWNWRKCTQALRSVKSGKRSHSAYGRWLPLPPTGSIPSERYKTRGSPTQRPLLSLDTPYLTSLPTQLFFFSTQAECSSPLSPSPSSLPSPLRKTLPAQVLPLLPLPAVLHHPLQPPWPRSRQSLPLDPPQLPDRSPPLDDPLR